MNERATLTQDGTLMFWCPGCDQAHGIPINGSRGWTWNGSLESPTVSPSINVSQGWCHSFVKDGQILFCADSKHALKGQRVNLPVWGSQWEEPQIDLDAALMAEGIDPDALAARVREKLSEIQESFRQPSKDPKEVERG